jgi:hypothetical protein
MEANPLSQLMQAPNWQHTILTEGGALEMSENSCPVCYIEWQPGVIITKLPCNHVFHYSCVIIAIQQHRRCPQCRQNPLPPNQAIPSALAHLNLIRNHIQGLFINGGVDQEVFPEMVANDPLVFNGNELAQNGIRVDQPHPPNPIPQEDQGFGQVQNELINSAGPEPIAPPEPEPQQVVFTQQIPAPQNIAPHNPNLDAPAGLAGSLEFLLGINQEN